MQKSLEKVGIVGEAGEARAEGRGGQVGGGEGV